MELGKARLRRNAVNNLRNAVHPEHGLIWTDGKGIYLAPVQLNHDQKVDKAASLRLGEFENVQSVQWSCSLAGGGCYMAAVHQSNVTVWHVSGTVPHLAFKQVRKINVQPIPQGCLWNPKFDILCLLSRQQCSFYFRHMHNRGSFAFPSLENGKISCGCWSPDGKRLVLCVGAALLIYTWTDVETSINDFVTTAWRIPGVSGNITAIVTASESSVVCASDLPLDVLCANNNQDSFAFPGAKGMEAGSDGVIRPDGASSVKDSLLNLQPSSKIQVQDAVMLSMIQLRSGVHDPTVVTSCIVPALLSPDLLHFQVESQCVVVGSSTQCELLVFALLDSQLLCAGHLTLEKDQRPKGICGLPMSQPAGNHGVLVLVGKSEAVDTTFPSTTNTAVFSLSLNFFPTKPEKARQVPNGLAVPIKTSASVRKPEIQYEPQIKSVSDSKLLSRAEQNNQSRQSPEEENGDNIGIRLSASPAASRDSESKLVQDITDSSQGAGEAGSSGRQGTPPQALATERVDFSQSSPRFSNLVLSKKYEMNWNEVPHDSSVKDTPSETSGVLRSEVRKSEETSKLSNGQTCADKAEPKFPSPNNSVDRSVKDSSLGAQQAVSPPLSTLLADRGEKQSGDDTGSVCSSLNSSDSNYEVLEKQIQTQRDQIDALQKRLADLSLMVQDTACVFPVRYQKVTEPEAVTIECVVGGKRVSRKFLLDNGRLQLDPVKLAFGLLTVELVLEGEPLVLGANIDGYIPVRFSPGSVLQVTGIPVAYSPQLTGKSHNKEPS